MCPVPFGAQVVGFDVSAHNLQSFVASGGIAAESPLAVAAQAKTVVTMLPAGAHVLEAPKTHRKSG